MPDHLADADSSWKCNRFQDGKREDTNCSKVNLSIERFELKQIIKTKLHIS